MNQSISDNSQRRFDLEGVELSYPTDFRDGSSSMGIFSVPSRVANTIIKDSGFRVAEIAPGKAALSLICVHYTDTDCGVYEEIAMAFFVEPIGKQKRLRIPYLSTWVDILKGRVASYTWCLPVNSTLARDCGIFMWGFPKTLETIDYSLSAGRAESSWMVDDQLVLRFSVKAEGDKSSGPVVPPVYSIFEGRPHVSYLKQQYSRSAYHGRDGRLALGNHPVADTLRTLGLPKKPLVTGWNGHLEFEMSHPEPL